MSFTDIIDDPFRLPNGATGEDLELDSTLAVGGDLTVEGDMSGVDLELTGDLIVADEIRVGDETDNVTITPAGAIQLNGAATVWDDLRVPVLSTRIGPTGGPDLAQFADDGAGSTGVFANFFDKSTEESVHFAVQLPHAWKEGSDIYPHFHWSPTDTDTGDVIWGLEVTWANIDDAFPVTTIITATQAGSGVAKDHQLALAAAMDGTGKTHSSMLYGRAFRQAGSDDYNADAVLHEFDFHYEINQMGDSAQPGV